MTPDSSKLIQEIVSGRLDDDLEDIATAVAVRVRETMSTFAWRFQLDSVSVGELELTLAEWSEIQKATGVHLSSIKPEIHVDQLLAVGKVLLRTRGGLSAEDAAARVESMTAADVPTMITREKRDAPLDSETPAST